MSGLSYSYYVLTPYQPANGGGGQSGQSWRRDAEVSAAGFHSIVFTR